MREEVERESEEESLRQKPRRSSSHGRKRRGDTRRSVSWSAG